MTEDEWIEIINTCDPVYLIAAGAPKDEYEIEILDIIAKVQSCKSVEEVANLIQRVFADRYGDSAHNDRQRYLTAAKEVWFKL